MLTDISNIAEMSVEELNEAIAALSKAKEDKRGDEIEAVTSNLKSQAESLAAAIEEGVASINYDLTATELNKIYKAAIAPLKKYQAAAPAEAGEKKVRKSALQKQAEQEWLIVTIGEKKAFMTSATQAALSDFYVNLINEAGITCETRKELLKLAGTETYTGESFIEQLNAGVLHPKITV